MTRMGAALAALAIVGGCAGGGTVVTNTGQRADGEELTVRGAVGGLRPVVVLGAPPDGGAPEAVAAALRAPGFRPPTRFTPAPPPPGPSPTLVLAFGARAPGNALCRGEGATAAQPEGGGLLVSGALCRRGFVRRGATLKAAGVDGPSHPGFADAMAALTRSLYRRDQRRILTGF